MRTAALLIALTFCVATPVAHAYLAVEPLRAILSQADVRACIAPHALPAGRYAMRLTVDATGKPSNVEVTDTPAPLTPEGTACIVAAFTALRFPSMRRAAPVLSRTWVHGRRARVPVSHDGHADGRVRISWPFIITAP